jgi:hypothetical protein
MLLFDSVDPPSMDATWRGPSAWMYVPLAHLQSPTCELVTVITAEVSSILIQFLNLDVHW